MTLGKRIEEIMQVKGYTKNFIANKIGIHPSTLNNWIIGKTTPDSLKLDVLSDFLSVNTNWILTGEGEMIKSGDVNLKGDGNIANTGSIGGGVSSNSSNEKVVELEKEVIKLRGEVAMRDETIKGLRNELAVRKEMIDFLQKK
ncbi:helix-turn-helix domain-containing protein [Bacteroides propionicifaciens]|uniref:helix-turn-helix domain-containing protein n=1 Tax=Bacteroides propionicifaciens TaxID=392838 RepID=UPI00035FF735|nr:helix-turn-helix transcriptional regulator [Bacteroides propionicifaciens]